MKIDIEKGLHLFLRNNSRFYQVGYQSDTRYLRASTKSDNVKEATIFAKKWFASVKKRKKTKTKKSTHITNKITLISDTPKLTLYRRANYDNWYARFHIHGRWLTKSTGVATKREATEIAKDWYHDVYSQIRTGNHKVSNEMRFDNVSQQMLRRYRQRVIQNSKTSGKPSETHYREVSRIINNKILAFYRNYRIDEVTNKSWHDFKDYCYTHYNPNLSNKTLHQYKNAIRLVLNEALRNEYIDALPVFKEDVSDRHIRNPRIYFTPAEYRKLIIALRKNIAGHTNHESRRYKQAVELRDMVIWISNSGMRVSETLNIRLCDCTFITDIGTDGIQREVIYVENIKGKRGMTGACKTYIGAVNVLDRIIKRNNLNRKNYKNSKNLLFTQHHRDGFNNVLTSINLKKTNDRIPKTRDFVSLRHTYISYRLLNQTPLMDLAMNCRTSVEMIEQHYNDLTILMSKSINNTLPKSFGDIRDSFGQEESLQ